MRGWVAQPHECRPHLASGAVDADRINRAGLPLVSRSCRSPDDPDGDENRPALCGLHRKAVATGQCATVGQNAELRRLPTAQVAQASEVGAYLG